MQFPVANGSPADQIMQGPNHRRTGSNDKKMTGKGNNTVSLKYGTNSHNYNKTIDASNLLAASSINHSSNFAGGRSN